MLTTTGWTTSSCQSQTMFLPDGSSISITLNFVPLQYGWFIQSLTYDTFVVQNLRLVTSLNILSQWKNILPFGLSCMTTDGGDPTQQQDFSTGYATLYILESTDLSALETVLND